MVGNPSVTRPNGQRRVRCGLPVIREELAAQNANRFRYADFRIVIGLDECIGDLSLIQNLVSYCGKEVLWK